MEFLAWSSEAGSYGLEDRLAGFEAPGTPVTVVEFSGSGSF